MKKIIRDILCIGFIVIIFTTTIHTYAMSDNDVVKVSATKKSKKETKRSGWVKKGGKKYYYKKNRKVTGWKRISGKKYYFNKKGQLQTQKMIEKNKYVNKKGVLVSKEEIFENGKKGLSSLEKKLKNIITGYGGTHSIYVKNLDTNEYCMVNNITMYPASLIKLYVMGCTYEYIKKNKIEKTSQIQSWLNSMITVSSNDSYNLLLSKIGGESVVKGVEWVDEFCRKQGYSQTASGGSLLPSYLTPQYKGPKYTTVKDCGHILEDIYRGTLVSKEASQEMLSLLKRQERRSKIPAGLPSGVISANKTGENDTCQHDAAIVFGKNTDYIIVIMSTNDGAGISHISSLSSTVYQYFNSPKKSTLSKLTS